MILYYSPGACSLADHIALYEAGLKFSVVKVDLQTHTLEDGRPLSDINPKNYVPVLQLDDGELLTENIAILSFIADKAPALIPPGPMGRYRLLEMLGFISAETHKAFEPVFSPDATETEKKQAAEKITSGLTLISTLMKGPYLFGEHASVADCYLYVVLMWARNNKLAIPANLSSFSQHMTARPTVQVALKHEGLV
jgi:glutathione S-transferase